MIKHSRLNIWNWPIEKRIDTFKYGLSYIPYCLTLQERGYRHPISHQYVVGIPSRKNFIVSEMRR